MVRSSTPKFGRKIKSYAKKNRKKGIHVTLNKTSRGKTLEAFPYNAVNKTAAGNTPYI